VVPDTVVPLDHGLDIELLAVEYTEGPGERYQVVVQHGSPGTDAVAQPESARRLLALIASSAVVGEVLFSREPGVALPAGEAVRVIEAEQSNTSVVFDEEAILKLFRLVQGGVNPDIELNRVLAAASNEHVARLLGSFSLVPRGSGQACPLGMLSEYAAGSVDGWRMATAPDSGADFAAEAGLLGGAVASVHADLARALGVSTGVVPVDRMSERLSAAASSVPELGRYVRAIERRYTTVAGRPVTVQRVHGDLHLGQVLRTPQTWLLIDFEGEPGQPLDQRGQPDSPLRDIAGMLRSFAYAARQSSGGGHSAEWVQRTSAEWVQRTSAEWVQRTSSAFCDGYAAGSGFDPRADAEVLAVYELDKAVYEAAYEARHRPDWLHIPLDSIARLVGQPGRDSR
jgi:maltokinase